MQLDAATLRIFTGDRAIVGVPRSRAERSMHSRRIATVYDPFAPLPERTGCGGQDGGCREGSCESSCSDKGGGCGCGGACGSTSPIGVSRLLANARSVHPSLYAPPLVPSSTMIDCMAFGLTADDERECERQCMELGTDVKRCWKEWSHSEQACVVRSECRSLEEYLQELEDSATRWWIPPRVSDETFSLPGMLTDSATLAPPTGRTRFCEGFMLGMDRELAECLVSSETRSRGSVDAVEPSDYRDFMSIAGNPLNAEIELLRKAWGILVLNQDLVDWAFCLVLGPGEDTDAIHDHIEPPDWRARVRVDFNWNDWTFFSTPGAAGGEIRIGRLNATWLDYRDKWMSGNTAHQRCAALDLSATLFHEILHTVGRGLLDWIGVLDRPNGALDPGGGACYAPYLLENIYRWALFQRYPWASESACCAIGLDRNGVPRNMDDLVFGYHGPVYPVPGCS